MSQLGAPLKIAIDDIDQITFGDAPRARQLLKQRDTERSLCRTFDEIQEMERRRPQRRISHVTLLVGHGGYGPFDLPGYSYDIRLSILTVVGYPCRPCLLLLIQHPSDFLCKAARLSDPASPSTFPNSLRQYAAPHYFICISSEVAGREVLPKRPRPDDSCVTAYSAHISWRRRLIGANPIMS